MSLQVKILRWWVQEVEPLLKAQAGSPDFILRAVGSHQRLWSHRGQWASWGFQEWDAAELQAGIMEGSVGAMQGRNSAAGMSLPLLTQWKACLVAGFLFCGCPWWGARAASSSSEKLRELSGTCPDLPLASSVLSWKKELYL